MKCTEFPRRKQYDFGQIVSSGINRLMSSKMNETPGEGRQAIREQIDENLKRVYAAALNEELPDRFRELLAQLKARGASGAGGEQ
jgi:hypothetical protein